MLPPTTEETILRDGTARPAGSPWIIAIKPWIIAAKDAGWNNFEQ
jgi:hypothetical protein